MGRPALQLDSLGTISAERHRYEEGVVSRIRLPRTLAVVVILLISLSTLAAVAPAADPVEAATGGNYVVVFRAGADAAGLTAVERAGGQVLEVNKLGIARVHSDRAVFAAALRN